MTVWQVYSIQDLRFSAVKPRKGEIYAIYQTGEVKFTVTTSTLRTAKVRQIAFGDVRTKCPSE